MINIMYTVDPIKRIVKPMSGHAVAEQDHEASSLRFAFPDNIAGTGLDSTGTAVRVMYIRPDGGDPVAKTLTFYKHSGGYYLYDWNLQKSDLQKEGCLVFSLCILDISGGEVEEWHTTPYQIRVLGSIHTDDSDEGDETITPTVAQRVAVLESMIQRVASGAPIVVTSASAMTDTDKIYILSTDSKWYYYNLSSSAWVAGGEYGGVATGSITTDKLADGAVTTAKIADGVIPDVDATLTQTGAAADAKVVGGELSDLKIGNVYLGNFIANKYITTAGRLQSYDGWKATDYIEVSSGVLSIEANGENGSKYNAFYDSEKTFISTFSFSIGNTEIDVPSSAKFFRLSMPNATNVTVAWWVVSELNKVKSLAEEGIATLTNDMNGKLIKVQNQEIIFGNFVDNSYVDRDGTIKEYNGWSRTDYVNVEDLESVTVVSSRTSVSNCFFDKNKNFIKSFSVGTSERKIQVPFNAAYVMFSNTEAGMDALVVTKKILVDKEAEIAYGVVGNKIDLNSLEFAQGDYNKSGGIISDKAYVIHADIPSESLYIANNYNGVYYFAIWDNSGTFLGAQYHSGFVASGTTANNAEYYQNIASIKPLFDEYPNAKIQLVYRARDTSTTLINTEDFNSLCSIVTANDGTGIDTSLLIENTITGVYSDNNIDSKLSEYGQLLVNSGTSDTFVFFTDPHPFYTATGLEDGWKNAINRKMPLIGKAYNSTGTEFCLCGGDWLGNSDTPEIACTKLGYVTGIMKNLFNKYYMVNGNHDTNYQGTAVLSNDALINAMFSREGIMYYAFKAANARFYVFDSGIDNVGTMSAYRWGQIDWFASNLIENDDVNSVIAIHVITNQYKESFETNPVYQQFATNVMALAEAYNSKTTITMNGKTYDFSTTTGKVRFAIAGHSHFDAITTLHNIPIMITTWVRAGSISTFDLVLADYTNNEVKTVRIGSGQNRTMTMA